MQGGMEKQALRQDPQMAMQPISDFPMRHLPFTLHARERPREGCEHYASPQRLTQSHDLEGSKADILICATDREI